MEQFNVNYGRGSSWKENREFKTLAWKTVTGIKE
jgi:hypothetical protein